jgi:hypothetical protein
MVGGNVSEMWYLLVSFWGIVAAWAVIEGFKG